MGGSPRPLERLGVPDGAQASRQRPGEGQPDGEVRRPRSRADPAPRPGHTAARGDQAPATRRGCIAGVTRSQVTTAEKFLVMTVVVVVLGLLTILATLALGACS